VENDENQGIWHVCTRTRALTVPQPYPTPYLNHTYWKYYRGCTVISFFAKFGIAGIHHILGMIDDETMPPTPMLEIPLYAGLGLAAGYTILAAWMMNQITATLPLGSGESSGPTRMMLTLIPFEILILCGMSVFIAMGGQVEILGLLIASMGSMALLIPLVFSKSMTWFGRQRATPEQFVVVLILAYMPMTLVVFAFVGLFIFDPWPTWHVASIMIGGLVAPAMLAFAIPSGEIPLTKTDMTDADGNTIETNFPQVLIRIIPIGVPMLIWFTLGFVYF